MRLDKDSVVRRYGLATIAVLAACGIRLALRPLFNESAPHFIFTLAIVLAAWRGGLGPGLAATGLSAAAADYFFVKPYFVLTLFSHLDVGVILFAMGGVLISWLSELRLQAEADQRRLLLGERQARARAEAAARAEDEFLATVSHELRTPLNAIFGWMQILKREARSNEGVLNAADVIERNAKVQQRLVDDLLDSARVVNNKLALQIRPMELGAVIRQALEAVRPSAETKSIQLCAVIDPGAPSIVADPERLEQVIWNLLSNAIKFTPEGGKVDIRLKRDRHYLLIRVSDTGRGIRAEFLPFVFDRFCQADGANRRSGLGLGLYLAHRIVELHGGTVHADSAGPGRGASFTVRLPLASGQDDNIHRAEGPAPILDRQESTKSREPTSISQAYSVDQRKMTRPLYPRLVDGHPRSTCERTSLEPL
jgi:signal transduction histidine kinase